MKDNALKKETRNKLKQKNYLIKESSQLKFEINHSHNKEAKLFGNKSFLEIILGLVKNTQNSIVINKGKKFNDISNIKKILKSLFNDLLQIEKEKEKQLNLNENIIRENETKFFNKNQSNRYPINSVKNSSKNLDPLIFETNESKSSEDISQLKTINFRIHNEIKKVENLIKRKQFETNYYRITNNLSKKKHKVIYINNNDNEIVNHILHSKLINRRKIFIECASMKNCQDNYINYLSDNINIYKNNIKAREQLREKKSNRIDTIIENTENDEISINNNMYCNSFELHNININTKLIKDNIDIIEKNNSNKGSTCDEETNCN